MIKVFKDALDLCSLNAWVSIFNSAPATIVRGSADRRDDFDDDGDDGNDDDGQNMMTVTVTVTVTVAVTIWW